MVIASRLIPFAFVVALTLTSCAGKGNDGENVPPPGTDDTQENLSCGSDSCTRSEMCVETIGALCSPLPEPGESCAEGCILTEHCCNCPAFGCLEPSSEDCPEGPSCGCLTRPNGESILIDCEGDRRECTQESGWTNVTCIVVGLDENPFAEETGFGGVSQ